MPGSWFLDGFAPDFAVPRPRSFLWEQLLAAALILLFLFPEIIPFFFFFVTNNDLSCLFKEFITPQKRSNNPKEVSKEPLGWEPLASIGASALCSYQTITKLEGKEKINTFGVNKDKFICLQRRCWSSGKGQQTAWPGRCSFLPGKRAGKGGMRQQNRDGNTQASVWVENALKRGFGLARLLRLGLKLSWA